MLGYLLDTVDISSGYSFGTTDLPGSRNVHSLSYLLPGQCKSQNSSLAVYRDKVRQDKHHSGLDRRLDPNRLHHNMLVWFLCTIDDIRYRCDGAHEYEIVTYSMVASPAATDTCKISARARAAGMVRSKTGGCSAGAAVRRITAKVFACP